MDNNNTVNADRQALLNAMEEGLAKMKAAVSEQNAVVEADVFQTPRIHTAREEKFYKAAEKVLDKTFGAYGAVKDRAIPAAKEKSVAAVVKSRNVIGSFIKKIGEKIEVK